MLISDFKKSEISREAKLFLDTFLTTVLPCQYRVSKKINKLTLKKCGNKFTYDVVLKCGNNFSFVFFFVYGVDLSEWHNGMHQLITITVAAFQTKHPSTYSKGSRAKQISTTLPVWINIQKLKSCHLRTEITTNYHDPTGRALFSAKSHAGCITLMDSLTKTREKYILKFEYIYIYKIYKN
jgi:hypothetical protein